jgi:hypothetical protein
MASLYRPHSTPLSPYRWALWVFLVLLAGTVGFFYLLGHDLHFERIKEKPVGLKKER